MRIHESQRWNRRLQSPKPPSEMRRATFRRHNANFSSLLSAWTCSSVSVKSFRLAVWLRCESAASNLAENPSLLMPNLFQAQRHQDGNISQLLDTFESLPTVFTDLVLPRMHLTNQSDCYRITKSR